MRITVRVKPGAKKVYINKLPEPLLGAGRRFEFEIAVKEPARDGKANRAVERALAEYFHLPISHVRIVAGHLARMKIIEIDQSPEK